MIVRRMGVFSVAKLSGLLYGLLGFVIGIFFSLFSLAMSGMAREMGEPGAAIGMLFGIGAVVIMPIFYGGIGFVGGALMAWLYNVIAGWVGGVELELVEERPMQPQAPTMPAG